MNEHHPLTTLQRVIWYDQLLHPQLPLCNIGGRARLRGPVSGLLLEASLQRVIAANEALRTRLHPTENEPVQYFAPPEAFSLEIFDFSGAGEAAALAWMDQLFAAPFQPFQRPLCYFALCKLADEHYLWLGRYHHLIADGQTVSLVGGLVAEVYNALLHDVVPEIPPSGYLKFLADDLAYRDSALFAKSADFWRQKFTALPEPSPLFHPAEDDETHRSDMITTYLERPEIEALAAFAQEHRVSVFHVMLAALYSWLVKSANRDDLVLGLPIRNRGGRTLKRTVGLFVGMIPAWFRLDRRQTFHQLVNAIRTELTASYRYQRYPINLIAGNAGLFAQSRQSLFEVSFSYQQHDYDHHFAGIPMEALPVSNGILLNDLAIAYREFHQGEAVHLDFEYRRAAMERPRMEALIRAFHELLPRLLAEPHRPLSQHANLALADSRHFLRLSEGPKVDLPPRAYLLDLFAHHVAESPNTQAFVYEEHSLTYAELEARANRLAHYLIARGIGPESLVAIAPPMDLRLAEILLAILKTGAAYLPLDPNHPDERLHQTIVDARCPLLITTDAYAHRFPEILFYRGRVFLERDHEAILAQPTTPPVPLRPFEDGHAVYVLFTSGSTGRPKGVVVTQRALYNKITDLARRIDSHAGYRHLAMAPLTFDPFVEQFFVPLTHGGTAVLVPEPEKMPPGAFPTMIQRFRANTVSLVPSHLIHFLTGLEPGAFTHQIQDLIMGGEALPASLVRRVRELDVCKRIINSYGPTEGTIDAVAYTVPDTFDDTSVPIGTPMTNYRAYVLDDHLNPLPAQIAGELYLAGLGLARGYLNRPGLTACRFLPDPFSAEPGARMYRSGDRARWNETNQLVFAGRVDHQVKLRGVRIELGEIEAALGSHPQLEGAIAHVWREANGADRLVGYVQAREQVPNDGELRAHLLQSLPGYMVPTAFIALPNLPFDANGKVDRKALPKPALQGTSAAPETPLEQELAAIWCQVLQLEQVGTHDNFFDLGGTSLTVNQVYRHIEERWGKGLELIDLFQHPTIAALADELRKKTQTHKAPSPPRERGGKQRGQSRRQAMAAAATRTRRRR